MGLSRAGAELIARFEGFVTRPYNDAAGHATIGFGHLIHHGPVTAADRAHWGTISRGRGLVLLSEDARDAARAVENAVRVPLSQEQFDALVSFVFNVGVGAFGSSTLLRKLNAGDRRGAADEFLRWSRAGGRVLEGLLRRRRAERALFLSSTASPHAVLTARERRLVSEYDRLVARGLNRARRRQLRQAMIAQRQRIWRTAQESGWGQLHRRARYRALLARTQ
jgi:GH24 family phage-related lysozyme (muramidase)